MEIKGDFLGFKFGEFDCADLGIVRTSDGDRIEEQLQPDIKDITAEVPGMHGEYYFGSTYGNKTISVSFAFDDMSEVQFRQMRRHFGVGQIQELVFSERPYKRYMAKIASPIELSYVCFDRPKRSTGAERDGVRRVLTEHTDYETDPTTGEVTTVTTYSRDLEKVTPYVYDYTQTERVYKGDGKIEFVCYFPFAKSRYKTLPVKNLNNVYEANLDEWKESSGILTESVFDTLKIDRYDATNANNKRIRVYNAGDVECGFRLGLRFPTSGTIGALNLTYVVGGETIAQLNLKEIQKLDANDTGVLIDTNNGLIVGMKDITTTDNGRNYTYKTTGIVYNEYVSSGYFFKLKTNSIENGVVPEAYINISGNPPSTVFINYDYLYF